MRQRWLYLVWRAKLVLHVETVQYETLASPLPCLRGILLAAYAIQVMASKSDFCHFVVFKFTVAAAAAARLLCTRLSSKGTAAAAVYAFLNPEHLDRHKCLRTQVELPYDCIA
jgi:hypothetical protein